MAHLVFRLLFILEVGQFTNYIKIEVEVEVASYFLVYKRKTSIEFN